MNILKILKSHTFICINLSRLTDQSLDYSSGILSLCMIGHLGFLVLLTSSNSSSISYPFPIFPNLFNGIPAIFIPYTQSAGNNLLLVDPEKPHVPTNLSRLAQIAFSVHPFLTMLSSLITHCIVIVCRVTNSPYESFGLIRQRCPTVFWRNVPYMIWQAEPKIGWISMPACSSQIPYYRAQAAESIRGPIGLHIVCIVCRGQTFHLHLPEDRQLNAWHGV